MHCTSSRGAISLEQDPVDAQPKRLQRLAVVDPRGDENDAGRQAFPQDLDRDLEPALARQPGIQDGEVGPMGTHCRQRLWAVARGGPRRQNPLSN